MSRKFLKLFGLFLAILLVTSAKVDAAPNWNTGVIQVTGMGVANPNMSVSPAHLSMMARRAAITDAYRQLAEMVNGVQVDAETTVEQMILTLCGQKLMRLSKVRELFPKANFLAAATPSQWKFQCSAAKIV